MRITINVNGKDIVTKTGVSLLEAARKEGIYIPTLCDHPLIEPSGSCRLCIVEVKGMRGYPPACTTTVADGMVVRTESRKLRALRRNVLELTLSEHPYTCLICEKRERCDDYMGTIRKAGVTTGCQYCPKNGECELQDLVEYLNLEEMEFPIGYRSVPVEQDDPFFDRDYNLCIFCGRCVRVCNDVRCNGTLTFGFRGGKTIVGTAFGKSHLDVGCEFCGACVDVCPVGALYDKRSKWEGCPDGSVPSVCSYCSIGCSLDFNLKENHLVSTTPTLNGTLNKGHVCVRGRFGVVDILNHANRLHKPAIKIDGRWVGKTWEDALNRVAEKLAAFKGDGFALVASPQGTNEDAYVLQKFGRAAMQSPHVTNSSNFARNGFVEALVEIRKRGDLYAGFEDIEKAAVIIVWGADLSVSHPIAALKVKHAQKAGALVVVVDPRTTKLAERSDLHVRLHPGSDRMLIAALLKHLFEMATSKSRSSRLKGSDAFSDLFKDIDVELAAKESGVSAGAVEAFVQKLDEAESVVFMFGSGLALQESAKESIFGLIDLAMCLRESKVLPVAGENNLFGCLEMGCHPKYLPGLIAVDDEKYRGKMERKWKTALSPNSGLGLTEIVKGIETGKIRALYAVGDLPKLEVFKKLDFFVVQSVFAPDWMMEAADAILPAAHIHEVDGTVMNFEGRIQRSRKVVKSAGESKPDWWICSRIAQRMGVNGFTFDKVSDVFREWTSLIPAYAGVTFQRLSKAGLRLGSRQNAGKPDCRFLPFTLEGGNVDAKQGYPIRLMTGWNLYAYRNGPLAEYIPGMERLLSEDQVEIHPKDAGKMGAQDGDRIRLVLSNGFQMDGLAAVTDRVLPKTAYLCMNPHLFSGHGISEGNFVWVKIKKVADE